MTFDPDATYRATVDLPGRLWLALTQLATSTGRTPGDVIEQAVTRRLAAVTAAEAKAIRTATDPEHPRPGEWPPTATTRTSRRDNP